MSTAGVATARLRARRRHAGPVRVLGPRGASVPEQLVEAWRYRHLVPYFARRMIEKRYRRTWLGPLWIPLRPVLDIGARTLLFGGLLGVSSGHVPYLVFLLVGMSVWQLFERTVFWGMRTLELNRGLLRKVYVPRLVPLASAVAPGLLDFFLYGSIVVIAIVYYRLKQGVLYLRLDYGLLQAVVGLALLLTLALGFGLWLSVVGAMARDVRFVMRYVLSFWTYLTPVLYPLDSLHGWYAILARLNPATAPLEMVKSGFIRVGVFSWHDVAVTLTAIVLLYGGGLWFFNRAEAAALDRL